MRLLDIYSLCVNYSLVIESKIILILLVKDALPFVFIGVFVVARSTQLWLRRYW